MQFSARNTSRFNHNKRVSEIMLEVLNIAIQIYVVQMPVEHITKWIQDCFPCYHMWVISLR